MMIRGEKHSIKKNLDVEAKLHNRFDVEVRDARTGELKQKAVGYNTILDQFWTRLFANQSVYDYIQYGSGTGTPSAADTALFNWVAGAQCGAYSYDDAHYAQGWNSFTRSITLDEQTAVGVEITEVGLAGAANSGLCTHALLQDMNGNPISIVKTDTDIITIYATVYIHWNVNGVNGVRYFPSSHWFFSPINYDSYDRSWITGGKAIGWRGTAGSGQWEPLDLGAGNKSFVIDSSNKTISIGPYRVPANKGNVNGLSHIVLTLVFDITIFDIDISGAYQITGETVGTGDGVTTGFDTMFDAPYDLTVYVDGVAQTSGITTGSKLGMGGCSLLYYFNSIEESDAAILVPRVNGPFKPTDGQPRYYTNGVYENPYYQTRAVTNITVHSNYNPPTLIIDVSDNGYSWINIFNDSGSVRSCDVPLQYQHSRFWRITHSNDNQGTSITMDNPEYAIIFSTPPSAGAVITADYKTPFLPKDSDHVYDFALTVQLGEYSGV